MGRTLGANLNVDAERSGGRQGLIDRVAGAPISWGICEVPGWGLQLPVERVLSEMRELGLHATELGAIGWLPTDPEALRRVLDAHGLQLVGAFVPLVCHEADKRHETLESAATTASMLAAVGAQHFVTAVVSNPADWQRPPLTSANWDHVFRMIDELESVTAAHGLRQVLHPHVDTLVETADEVQRVLDTSEVAICLDTGHLTIGGTDPLDFARQAASRVGLVHLKDVRTAVAARLNAGELSLMAAVQAGLFAALGDGDVPIADVITELDRHGYDGLYVLEQDVAITAEPPAGDGPSRDVAKSVAYLRSVESSLSATLRAGAGSAVAGTTPITEH